MPVHGAVLLWEHVTLFSNKIPVKSDVWSIAKGLKKGIGKINTKKLTDGQKKL